MFNSKTLPFEEINAHQAAQKIKTGKPVVIDVREPYEFAQGHIEGARLMPLGNLMAHLDEIGSKEQELILVCRSGSRSSFAAQQLSSLGYKKIYNLSGGIVSWMLTGMPTAR